MDHIKATDGSNAHTKSRMRTEVFIEFGNVEVIISDHPPKSCFGEIEEVKS